MRDFFDYFQPTYLKPGSMYEVPKVGSMRDYMAEEDKRQQQAALAEAQELRLEQERQAMKYGEELAKAIGGREMTLEEMEETILPIAARNFQTEQMMKVLDSKEQRDARREKEVEAQKERRLNMAKALAGADSLEQAEYFYNQFQQEYPEEAALLSKPTQGALRQEKPEKPYVPKVQIRYTTGPKKGGTTWVPEDVADKLIMDQKATIVEEKAGSGIDLNAELSKLRRGVVGTVP